jgi:hypothetical protein
MCGNTNLIISILMNVSWARIKNSVLNGHQARRALWKAGTIYPYQHVGGMHARSSSTACGKYQDTMWTALAIVGCLGEGKSAKDARTQKQEGSQSRGGEVRLTCKSGWLCLATLPGLLSREQIHPAHTLEVCMILPHPAYIVVPQLL